MSRTASKKSAAEGFTLIELLIVIGIIGILAAIVLVAVDPTKRLRQSRNARRSAEANAILNAILNYTVDFKGALPAEVLSATTGFPVVIGTTAGVLGATVCPAAATGTVNATTTRNLAGNTALVDAYISSIPIDPRGVNDSGDVYSAATTGYFFSRSANGRIEVGSCNPEDEGEGSPATIKIKR